MDDMISRKALLELIQSPKCQVWFNRRVTQSAIHWATYLANDVPEVEAEPLRHGRWIYRDAVGGQVYCSECCTLEKNTDANYKSRRCPGCGAKMDG